MESWASCFKTKIKEDNQASAGNEIHRNVTDQFFRVMESREPTYTRMNGIVTIMIPYEFIKTRGLSGCIKWKKLNKYKKQKG